jgi:hypothetical protein
VKIVIFLIFITSQMHIQKSKYKARLVAVVVAMVVAMWPPGMDKLATPFDIEDLSLWHQPHTTLFASDGLGLWHRLCATPVDGETRDH